MLHRIAKDIKYRMCQKCLCMNDNKKKKSGHGEPSRTWAQSSTHGESLQYRAITRKRKQPSKALAVFTPTFNNCLKGSCRCWDRSLKAQVLGRPDSSNEPQPSAHLRQNEGKQMIPAEGLQKPVAPHSPSPASVSASWPCVAGLHTVLDPFIALLCKADWVNCSAHSRPHANGGGGQWPEAGLLRGEIYLVKKSLRTCQHMFAYGLRFWVFPSPQPHNIGIWASGSFDDRERLLWSANWTWKIHYNSPLTCRYCM